MSHHHDLIDTTEMYLKTVFELEEEGVVTLRARIAERLHQSGPTVSQTVARMDRDGLMTVQGDRHLKLTDAGRQYATRVMRKHRLVERLLVDVIGLEWELVHVEACRWEHVVSEDVERRLVEILDHPATDPYGNPIPGLSELGDGSAISPPSRGSATLISLGTIIADGSHAAEGTAVVVRRIGEMLQTAPELLSSLQAAGVMPGRQVSFIVEGDKQAAVRIGAGDQAAQIPTPDASHIFVERL